MNVSLPDIVLIGFKSSGKTTIGRLLAADAGFAFHDLDDLLVQLYERETGDNLTARQIFQTHGEERFRELEAAALSGFLQGHGIVLATGGGAPLAPANQPLLRRIGTIVYLQVEPAVIHARFEADGWPAYLQDNPTLAGVEAVWGQRHPVYRRLADRVVDVSTLSPAQAAAKVELVVKGLDETPNE